VEWTKGELLPMVLVRVPLEIAAEPERNSVRGLDPQPCLIRATPHLHPPWTTMSAPAETSSPLAPDGSTLDRTTLVLPWSVDV